MAYLGDFPASAAVYAIFTTVKATGSPGALVSGAARIIKNGATGTPGSTGVTLTANIAGKTGLNRVRVLTSGAIYTSGNYHIILSTGSVDGKNVAGYAIDSFSIKARNRLAYTLTTGQHDSIGTRTWAVTARILTSGAAVWAAGTKVLTSGAVVWTAGARTLTSGATVWAVGTKVLTSGGVMWTAGARTLTSGAVLTTAALSEQASVPAAAPSLGAAIQWNYQAIRNKRITTATADLMHTSATAVAGTAALSYVSGTNTFTKGKQS